MITDGENNKGDWPSTKLENRIVNENVRVITLAIGYIMIEIRHININSNQYGKTFLAKYDYNPFHRSASDPDLEHLAEISNGISYFQSQGKIYRFILNISPI